MLALAPAALLLSLAQGSAPPAAAPQPVVTGTRFVAIDTRSEPPSITESTTIPYRPLTSCFGWIIEVQPAKGEARVREELRLPAPARNWETSDDVRIHPDRAGATVERTDDLADGALTGEWCLSEGDPTGAHSISVHSGDRLLHRFEFTVLPPPQAI